MLIVYFALITLLSTVLWSRFPPILAIVSNGHWTVSGVPQYQVILALGLATLILLSFLYWKKLDQVIGAKDLKAPTLFCGAFFVLHALALFLFQLHYHGAPGATPSLALESALFLGAGVLWSLAWMRQGSKPWLAALAALLALELFLSRQILAFPLDNGFSDMLLLIRSAGNCLLHGQSPYAVQHLTLGYPPVVEDLRTTYLPGMWLSYLPCVALGIDPRWMNLAFWAAFGALAYGAFSPRRRVLGAALLSLYFLNPWLQYRQDLYLPAYLWVMTFFYWALKRDRQGLAAVVFGWSMATYPFSWPLFPVWMAWRAGSHGWPRALRQGALALGMACAVVLPFVAWDPQGFVEGVFHHWAGAVEIDHYNLVYWLQGIGGYLWLLGALQWAALLLAVRLAWIHAASLGAFFGLLAVLLGVFLLAAYHVSHYFFFVPLAYLLIATAEFGAA